MMAVILAGGRGTRLRPYTTTIPKPLLPLGDYPILEIVVRQLVRCGFDRIALCLGHLAPLFRAYFGDGAAWGAAIEYYVEGEPLGTAGPLLQIPDWPDDALVMNGDLLTNIPFASVLCEHVGAAAAATIVLTRREVHIDYGVVETDGKHTLAAYVEKPTLPYQVSTGVYVVNRRALALLTPHMRVDMPHLMVRLKERGELVRCVVTDSYWKDMGRLDDYEQATCDFLANPARFLTGV